MIQSRFIRTRKELEQIITLTEAERRWFDEAPLEALPFMISSYYASLIDPEDLNDPIRAQIVPRIEECAAGEGESDDPQQENSYSPHGRFVHRYTSRAALLVSDTCTTYCRHCFRRRFTGQSHAGISNDLVKKTSQYLASHTEVKELLITGGDPLTLSDSRLDEIITTLREAREDLVLRLCTRTPVTYPERVSDRLIHILKKHHTAPVYIMTQFNHPREITRESRTAVARFADNGFPLMNQSVLLRGVNDTSSTLAELCNTLVSIRVKPYYLFNGDMVRGTAHLRLPLGEAIRIEGELRGLLSGLAMPVVAVDLPEGGGKVPVGELYYRGEQERESTCSELLRAGRSCIGIPDPGS